MEGTYYIGEDCTWHGPGTDSRAVVTADGPKLVCPGCGGELIQAPSEDAFWGEVRASDRRAPGYEAMMRWGQGRCFPDNDTLVNAYRQATAED